MCYLLKQYSASGSVHYAKCRRCTVRTDICRTATPRAGSGASKKFFPRRGKGLEIGVGTGKFALPLGIKVGVEPARAMAVIARQKGIEVHEAVAENLPFENGTFDFVLMVTVLCFLHNPKTAIEEIARVRNPTEVLSSG